MLTDKISCLWPSSVVHAASALA